MLQIYEHGFLRSAEKMFGANNKDWILQEDNDPKHRSHLYTSWKAENGITTLGWLSQSPDANPIENVQCREEETCRKACIHPEAALSTN